MKASTKGRFALLAFLGLSFVLFSGCAQMLSGLRKDLDDTTPYAPPVQGGRFNQGFLSDDLPENDRFSMPGHTDRGPASASAGAEAEGWVTPETEEANHRDAWRGQEGDGTALPMKMAAKRPYKNGNRATRADFTDDAPNEGSLWASDGQTNYYFNKNKVRGVGDLLSVNLDQEMVKNMTLEIRNRLTGNEVARELSNAQARIRAKVMAGDVGDPADLSSDRAPAAAAADAAGGGKKKAMPPQAAAADIPPVTEADIDLSKSVEVKAGDIMLAEILERYPNGNYKIRGTKRIPYKNGSPKTMNMVAVVRGADISEDDKVESGKLYEYRLDATR